MNAVATRMNASVRYEPLEDMAHTPVPFADLSIQWDQIRPAAMADLEKLFAESAFCQGPWATAFEAQIADYLGAKHAVAVNSGSSALHVATIAAGIGRGDKVLVPAHTFIGTIWGLIYEGAIPVFCDVDDATGTIDLADAERRMEPGVKAIIPVHLYGQPVDLPATLAFAERHGLTVIEDCAQAIGACHQGRSVGTFGAMGCFSFYPGKNLGGAGEGGLVVTDDGDKADLMRAVRNHGQGERYVHERVGYNYRMDGIQALVLSHKLRRLDGWTDQRRAVAARYAEALAGTPLRLPVTAHGDHVYHLYVVRTRQRDALKAFLDARGVQTGLHYPVPLYRQPCLSGIASSHATAPFPVTEDWAANGLSLPMFAGMTAEQQDQVIDAIHDFFKGSRS
ncbi:DegT/DnrJ/EryC1/StrS family aminotransferase [Sphingobium sp. DEHP117]|uniref:DegT/DnrJ/EryC1/StrS family aminotransferase n=1 Tax=Sphingobium sp. DEHP117 TaxID=2993436 RepID=UPI0027D4BF5C|nr:aminotransferase class I/II-fold pyridoxal phosphate-dependent enzyme [Sphingobium sp. DEHP117]MDQ4421387.1 DegT/DnrJ/EryC1/StrS family aminotransferase [Sphingobium sp. DEHP117]